MGGSILLTVLMVAMMVLMMGGHGRWHRLGDHPPAPTLGRRRGAVGGEPRDRAAAPMRNRGWLFLTCSLAVGILGCGHSACRSRSGSEVVGRVLVSPTCPGPVGGAGCGPEAYMTVVEALRHGRARARAPTDARGRFRLELPSGRYILKPQPNGPLPM